MSRRAKIFFTLLLVLGFLTRFIFMGYPNQVVFDETYFGKYASYYETGNYFFDLHPPLGKMMLGVAAYVGHYTPNFAFNSIGNVYPDMSYIILRLLPMILGSLMPCIIFLVARQVGLSDEASFFAGLLSTFENSLVVQSRFILIDIFIVFFGFLGLYFYLRYRKAVYKKFSIEKILLLIVSLVLFGCTLSTKWTGLSFLGIAGLVELRDIYVRKNKTALLKTLSLFLIIPAAVYVLVFAAHFYLLPKSGPGDGFMSSAFNMTLAGSNAGDGQHIQPAEFWDKFGEANIVMYQVQDQPGLAHHPYQSLWYSWPFMIRPIYYWNDDSTGAKIYLLGNPLVYWLSTLAVLLTALFLSLRYFQKWMHRYKHSSLYKKLSADFTIFTTKKSRNIAGILMLGFCANFLPFIGITRSMFVYHYFSGLLFACLILAMLCDQIGDRKNKIAVMTALTACIIVSFVYFAPLTYGIPLSKTAFAQRQWLPTWH